MTITAAPPITDTIALIDEEQDKIDIEQLEEITMTASALYRRVADKIIDETHCSRRQANSTIHWVERIVGKCRKWRYAPYHPTNRDMADDGPYQIFDRILEHGEQSRVGSAHALLEELLLDPSKGELALFHDNPDDMNRPEYCSVSVGVDKVRI